MKSDSRATNIVLPIKYIAWLRYQAAIESTTMTALIIRALQAEYERCAKNDPGAPTI